LPSVGPQIRELLSDQEFSPKLTDVQKEAWNTFRGVVEGFLGNNKAPDYKKRVEDMLTAFEKQGARMSIKIHFLHAYLNYFPSNLDD